MLVKESRNLGDRAYGFRNIYGKDFDKVVNRFAEEEGLDLSSSKAPNPLPNSQIGFDDFDDIFDDELLSINEPDILAPVKEILSNSNLSKETSEKMISIWESIKRADEDDKEKLLALKNTQQSLRLLNEIDISNSDPNTHQQIEGQLNAIISVSNILLSQLTK